MRNATMTDSLYRWSNTILVCDRQAQTVDFFSRDTRYTGASHHDVVPSTFPRGDTAATIHWRIEIFFFRGLVVCDSCLYSWFFFTGASRIRSRTGSTKFARVYEALTA